MKKISQFVFVCLIMVHAAPAMAQPDLVCGGQQAVSYDSNNVVQEFTIPTVNPPQFLRLSAEGADGGDAEAGGNNQFNQSGGKGAIATALFAVGSDDGQSSGPAARCVSSSTRRASTVTSRAAPGPPRPGAGAAAPFSISLRPAQPGTSSS